MEINHNESDRKNNKEGKRTREKKASGAREMSKRAT